MSSLAFILDKQNITPYTIGDDGKAVPGTTPTPSKGAQLIQWNGRYLFAIVGADASGSNARIDVYYDMKNGVLHEYGGDAPELTLPSRPLAAACSANKQSVVYVAGIGAKTEDLRVGLVNGYRFDTVNQLGNSGSKTISRVAPTAMLTAASSKNGLDIVYVASVINSGKDKTTTSTISSFQITAFGTVDQIDELNVDGPIEALAATPEYVFALTATADGTSQIVTYKVNAGKFQTSSPTSNAYELRFKPQHPTLIAGSSGAYLYLGYSAATAAGASVSGQVRAYVIAPSNGGIDQKNHQDCGSANFTLARAGSNLLIACAKDQPALYVYAIENDVIGPPVKSSTALPNLAVAT